MGSRADYISRWASRKAPRCLIGGEGRPAGLDRGWFVQPTIFTRVNNKMRIAREEIFGPVLCVIPYDDEDEAIAIANDSPTACRPMSRAPISGTRIASPSNWNAVAW